MDLSETSCTEAMRENERFSAKTDRPTDDLDWSVGSAIPVTQMQSPPRTSAFSQGNACP